MKLPYSRSLLAATYAGLLLISSDSLAAQTSAPSPTHDAERNKESEDVILLSPFTISTGLGATVGGSKDARFFRGAAARAQFPHPNTLTAEGLFAEHDLPLKLHNKGKDLLVLNGESMPARLLTRPDVRYLAQIGFSSTLDATTWRREPLNLIAVVDKSGSMDGEPLALVKNCLKQVVSQLGGDDQFSIVLYGDHSHVHLQPTRTDERNAGAITAAIEAIESNGSTNMEAGLQVGFDLARLTRKSFHGRTRVMQFTDERPNVGDTSEAGFMGLMETASRDGIGQTTIGVGVQFDAELAAKISTVRGGNSVYFANAAEMEETFEEDLDTLVTELAYDLDMTILPAPGLRVTGIYGVPGEILEWKPNRAVRFRVSTLFLSKRRGAIYAAFAPEQENLPAEIPAFGESLASVSLSYRPIGHDQTVSSELKLPFLDATKASAGLKRGRILVSEFLALKEAMTAHHIENNQGKAFGLLDQLRTELASTTDRSLRKEIALVANLHRSMARLAGYGETAASQVSIQLNRRK